MKVYNTEYELIGYVEKPSINGTYYDLNGKLVENNHLYNLYIDEYQHEGVCIRCDIPKCKMNPPYADFKDE